MQWLTIDCEACAGTPDSPATDPYRARIVQLAMLTVVDGRVVEERCRLINPGVPIDDASAAVHGITDEQVRGEPTFAAYAKAIQGIVDGTDAVASGYNSRGYDVPLLHTELRRAGMPGFPVDDMGSITVREVDPYLVWRAMEPRKLVDAVKRFLPDQYHHFCDDAHDALADARIAVDLVPAMGEHWGIDIDEMARLSKPEWEVDRAGKFRRDPNANTIRLNFGKHRHRPAVEHPGFLQWMIDPRRDFAPDTRAWAERLLGEAAHLARVREHGQGSASWVCEACGWSGHTDELVPTGNGGLACPGCEGRNALVPGGGEVATGPVS